MKITESNRKKSHKKFLIIATILLGVIAMAVGYYIFATTRNPIQTTQTGTNLSPPTKEQQQAGNSVKEQSINSSSENNSSKNTQDSDPNSSDNSASVTITASNQNNNVLQVRVLISSVINTGTCELKLSKNSEVITKSANVQALASSSTCQGFDIDTTNLTAGQWSLKVQLTANGKSSYDEKVITLK